MSKRRRYVAIALFLFANQIRTLVKRATTAFLSIRESIVETSIPLDAKTSSRGLAAPKGLFLAEAREDSTLVAGPTDLFLSFIHLVSRSNKTKEKGENKSQSPRAEIRDVLIAVKQSYSTPGLRRHNKRIRAN